MRSVSRGFVPRSQPGARARSASVGEERAWHMEGRGARRRAGRTESGAESEGVLPSLSRGVSRAPSRARPSGRPVEVGSAAGKASTCHGRLAGGWSMVFENTEPSFKASYLPYRELFIADFSTCGVPHRVPRYAYVLSHIFFESLRILTKKGCLVSTVSNG